jgi:23S rRNA (cytidine1920-2'-O)/16S rRNA (cytidine1409-2'-O)-methyltransferase
MASRNAAKHRLDVLLVERGLAETREKAQALVMAGQVNVGEDRAVKPGVLVSDAASLRVLHGPRFVSRGGEKLAAALERFGVNPAGRVGLDIGASTGGFTDCLLQNGATRVYAVDVGHNQIDYRLRTDSRVIVMEGVNAREPLGLPERAGIVTIDVSFISLRKVLPAAIDALDPGGDIVALFKPQFEAERAEVPKGGVITDPALHAKVIARFVAWCVSQRLRLLDLTASPILGAEGNREFLIWLRPGKEPAP